MAIDLSGVDLTKLTDEEIDAIERGTFFKKLKAVDTTRNYSIIVDRSGSMECSPEGGRTRWEEAKEAVEFLAPFVTKCDPDGISLYFFSSDFDKFTNVKTAAEISEKFRCYCPVGSTALHLVLEDAVKPDEPEPSSVFSCGGGFRPETILVITDGSPDDPEAVERVIIEATKNMKNDEDLSITIVQVGDDRSMDCYLHDLDNHLITKGAKFDIVDVISASHMKGLSFQDLIVRSVRD